MTDIAKLSIIPTVKVKQNKHYLLRISVLSYPNNIRGLITVNKIESDIVYYTIELKNQKLYGFDSINYFIKSTFEVTNYKRKEIEF